MATPRPQVNVEHLDEVNSYINQNRPVPIDLIDKCRRAGEALLHTNDAPWGWTTIVACAAASWDLDAARNLAEKAVHAIGPEPMLLCNLAVSFKHLCRPDLAVALSARGYDMVPHNADLVKCVLDDLYTLGRFREGMRIAKSKLHIPDDEQNGSIHQFAAAFEVATSAVETARLDEKHVQNELQCAMQVLSKAQQRHDSVLVHGELEPDDGTPSVVAQLQFFGSIEDELRLGSDLAVRLAELPSWDPCRLNTGFKYLVPQDVDLTA